MRTRRWSLRLFVRQLDGSSQEAAAMTFREVSVNETREVLLTVQRVDGFTCTFRLRHLLRCVTDEQRDND